MKKKVSLYGPAGEAKKETFVPKNKFLLLTYWIKYNPIGRPNK